MTTRASPVPAVRIPAGESSCKPNVIIFPSSILFKGRTNFQMPNFHLTIRKVVNTTLCTTWGCINTLNYPGFLGRVQEFPCREVRFPSWKYNIGRIFKITYWYWLVGISVGILSTKEFGGNSLTLNSLTAIRFRRELKTPTP